jgi:CPA1 family monovalent cation:H+ antiporter
LLSLMELSAVLLTLCALFGWLNHKYLPMPHTIGLLVMSVLASLVLVIVDASFPSQHLFELLTNALLRVDFSSVVMDGMLAFLLFAGALHVDVTSLKDRALPVIILATLGTVLSTAVVGSAFWFGSKMLGYPVSLAWSLVFGTLISPTDPVAVLSTLKNVAVPKSLESEMQGEALFNDGVGIVIFTIIGPDCHARRCAGDVRAADHRASASRSRRGHLAGTGDRARKFTPDRRRNLDR